MPSINTTGGVFDDDTNIQMVENIKVVFNCDDEDIEDVRPMQEGLTNVIMRFKIKGRGSEYVYRHPGLGSDALVDRGRETVIQSVVSSIGADPTLIAMDAEKGWRISRFVEHRPFDYYNLNDMVRAIMLLRRLHDTRCKVRWSFDVIEQAERVKKMIPEDKYGLFPEFEGIKERCYRLYELSKTDNIKHCITHGDCRDDNFLINDEECYLIDWEYGGFGDPGIDIGSYVCGGNHSVEDVDRILYTYYRRKPTDVQRRHFFGYIALTGWFFMHWTMLKESKGQKIGILKDLWYHYAKEFSVIALKMYEGE